MANPGHSLGKINKVLVLGGGSAGLLAALTLKIKIPQLAIQVVRSPELGVIGVGEGTTVSFPRHLFEFLRIPPQEFYAIAEPTWKLGVRFIWGPREYYYSFTSEHETRWPDFTRNAGFYVTDETRFIGPISALMAHGKAFAVHPQHKGPHFHNQVAFHIENSKLVEWLEASCKKRGVQIMDSTMKQAKIEGERVIALQLEDGSEVSADFFVDASGFRSELLGKALGVPYVDFGKSLFCDRAVIGGWPRTDEPILPYTTAETMESGWCWQIEHEFWINRGYVYSSRFISDEEALREFRAKNPKIANEPRVVKFRSGRLAKCWVGNCVGIGNSVGFVEPLEASALQVISVGITTFSEALADSLLEPTPTLIEQYNRFNTAAWDDIRDFLAVHYAFNTRLNTPFWETCRNDTDLAGAQFLTEFYRENGPSAVGADALIHPSNAFGIDGYLTHLVGQRVPHGKIYTPSIQENRMLKDKFTSWSTQAKAGYSVKKALEWIRQSSTQLVAR